MASQRDKMPMSMMNRRLLRAVKELKSMSLLERLQLQVKAKLLTEADLEEIKGRLSPEQLAAR